MAGFFVPDAGDAQTLMSTCLPVLAVVGEAAWVICLIFSRPAATALSTARSVSRATFRPTKYNSCLMPVASIGRALRNDPSRTAACHIPHTVYHKPHGHAGQAAVTPVHKLQMDLTPPLPGRGKACMPRALRNALTGRRGR